MILALGGPRKQPQLAAVVSGLPYALHRRAQRYDGALPCEHCRPLNRRGQGHTLSPLQPVTAVDVTPARPDGQIDLPLPRPFDEYRRHEQSVPEKKVERFIDNVRVPGKLVHQRPNNRLSGILCVGEEGVEIWNETVAEPNHLADDVDNLRMGPRFGRRPVEAPRVDGEARMKDAVLHPPHEKLRRRNLAPEAAHVVAGVRLTAHTEPEAHGDVILQGVPAARVVSAPGLRVTLDTGTTGTREHEGSVGRIVFLLSFIGGTRHEKRLERAKLRDANRPPEPFTLHLIVPDFVLVVVVPGGIDSVFEYSRAHAIFPPPVADRRGKIDVTALSTPEVCNVRPIRVPEKHPFGGGLPVLRVRCEQAWLDVGRDLHTAVVKSAGHRVGIRYTVAVPDEHIAFAVVAHGIPR